MADGVFECGAAGVMIRMPLIMPEQRRRWIDAIAGFEAARRQDVWSAIAFGAWRARWWRSDEGRGRRLFHLLQAADEQAYAIADPAPLVSWRPMPLGAARGIVRQSAGAWEPGEARADEWLATMPLYERVGGCLLAVEILAWRRDDPGHWYAATGSYDVLGANMALALRAAGEPVRIYASPSSWNRAGGPGAPGCCVLDWDSEFGRAMLHARGRLIADSRADALDLQRRIDKARPAVQFVARRGRVGRAAA